MLKGITIAVIVGVAAVGVYYLAGPLFYNKIIDEPLPQALSEIQQDLTYEKFVNMVGEQRNALVKKMPQGTIDLIMNEAKKSPIMFQKACKRCCQRLLPVQNNPQNFQNLALFRD